jgi:hypothetical protein
MIELKKNNKNKLRKIKNLVLNDKIKKKSKNKKKMSQNFFILI